MTAFQRLSTIGPVESGDLALKEDWGTRRESRLRLGPSVTLRSLNMRHRVSLFAFIGVMLWAGSGAAMVISEIHYHPAEGDDALEFIELTSDTTTPQDLSGFHFTEGIDFEFPAGTIVPSNGIVIVAADPDAVKARYGLEKVFGPFAGRLDNSNDRITFVNHAGAALQSVRYRDTGKWPVAADGAGHTLVLKNVYLDSGEPESWAQSPELGGSPGRPNFPTGEPQYKVDSIVEKGATWRYAKGTAAYSTPENAWREPGFDDAAWPEGPSGFGFADDDDATVLADMLNGYSTVAIRKKIVVTAEQAAAPGDFYLAINYDDGFCAFLDGKEIAKANCGTPEQEVIWNSIATLRREAGVEELFKIPAESLAPGEHTLAITGLNFRLADNDFSLIPRLVKRALIEEGGNQHAEVVFNELHHGVGPGSGWIEIYNPGASEVSLSGYVVTDDPARKDPVKLGDGANIGPHGFLLIAEGTHPFDTSGPKVQLFLIAPDGFVAAAGTFDRALPRNQREGR